MKSNHSSQSSLILLDLAAGDSCVCSCRYQALTALKLPYKKATEDTGFVLPTLRFQQPKRLTFRASIFSLSHRYCKMGDHYRAVNVFSCMACRRYVPCRCLPIHVCICIYLCVPWERFDVIAEPSTALLSSLAFTIADLTFLTA